MSTAVALSSWFRIMNIVKVVLVTTYVMGVFDFRLLQVCYAQLQQEY